MLVVSEYTKNGDTCQREGLHERQTKAVIFICTYIYIMDFTSMTQNNVKLSLTRRSFSSWNIFNLSHFTIYRSIVPAENQKLKDSTIDMNQFCALNSSFIPKILPLNVSQ